MEEKTYYINVTERASVYKFRLRRWYRSYESGIKWHLMDHIEDCIKKATGLAREKGSLGRMILRYENRYGQHKYKTIMIILCKTKSLLNQ